MCAGCGSAGQPGEETQAVAQPDQKKAAPAVVQRTSKPDADSYLVRRSNQPPVAGPGFGNKLDAESYLVHCLTLETVQKDLGLSVDQMTQFKQGIKTADEQFNAVTAKLRGVVPPNQAKAVMDDYQRKSKELTTKMLAMLTPGQIKRLKQIQIQAAFPAVLKAPKLIKELGISDEQSKKIQSLCDRVNEKFCAEHPPTPTAPEKRRQSLIELMKDNEKVWAEARKPILDVLTPDQRAKLEKLQGKKIELKWPYESMVPKDFGP